MNQFAYIRILKYQGYNGDRARDKETMFRAEIVSESGIINISSDWPGEDGGSTVRECAMKDARRYARVLGLEIRDEEEEVEEYSLPAYRGALHQLWEFLGVENQRDAVKEIRGLLGKAVQQGRSSLDESAQKSAPLEPLAWAHKDNHRAVMSHAEKTHKIAGGGPVAASVHSNYTRPLFEPFGSAVAHSIQEGGES